MHGPLGIYSHLICSDRVSQPNKFTLKNLLLWKRHLYFASRINMASKTFSCPLAASRRKFRGLSFHQLQSGQRKMLSFHVFKAFQWAAYVGATADVREDYHLARGRWGKTGLFYISKQGQRSGELQDLSRQHLPFLEKANIEFISSNFDPYYRFPVQAIVQRETHTHFQRVICLLVSWIALLAVPRSSSSSAHSLSRPSGHDSASDYGTPIWMQVSKCPLYKKEKKILSLDWEFEGFASS